jgi:glycine dehydrogenase subunit 2
MIEPTETESKEDIDKFIQVMIDIAKLADENPAEISKCPVTMPIRRLDELKAARKLDLASLE